ncbi:CTL-like protein 2 [Tribolium castaneum]|uniref:Choline transporter-like protein n=1 Tax=Tribolium castaneum TaxID=7070 RepID=A0A139WM68_TRICA|nr:CTL-like protein 2 [Tribolium castaneum]
MARSKIPEGLGEPIPYDPDFNGPLRHRSCTDIICLLIFFVFIGCWAGVAIYAFSSGDPNTLLVPKDSYGSRCGLDEHVKDRPYLFFFDLSKCFSPSVPFTGCQTKQVCVEKCPDYYYYFDQDPGNYKGHLICDYNIDPSQESPEKLVKEGKCARYYFKSSSFLNRCLYNTADRNKPNKDTNVEKEISELKKHLSKIAMWMSLFVQNTIGYFTDNQNYQQKPTHLLLIAVEKRCIPTIDDSFYETLEKFALNDTQKFLASIKNIKALSQAEQVGQNIVDDLVESWWKILAGVGIAVLVSIIYIMMLRWLAAPMVWLSLIGVLALLIAGVYFTTVKYIELKNKTDEDVETNNIFESYATKKDTWLVLLIICSIVLAIVLLMMIFLRKRIVLAIALVKEGSKAVSSVTSVLFFPVFPWILQIAVIAFAICVALYLATTGDPEYKIRGMTSDCPCFADFKNGTKCDPTTFRNLTCLTSTLCSDVTCKFTTMNNPKWYPYLQAFNIFGFFWGTFFVSALGQMILASVFATWYWTFNKSNLPFFAVLEATGRTLRYHIGTLAFGSLIIAICRMIRVALEYIDHKLKKYDNEITKAILCCCKCFFWCLEKFLKFLNRNAYIMCAIHGKNFCMSAKDAFMLLMRNILRVFVLDKVTDFLFFMGKLLITMGVGAISYVLFATDLTGIDNSGLHYEIVPVIVIMIITYIVATVFFNVYSMAVDTLFLCFLEDCERNDGSSEKPYYMSRNLMKILGKKNKQD